jgi:hypothetical protein
MIMDIINTDAEDTNLLTLFVFRQRCLRFDSQRSAFSLIRRLPSFGPRAEVTNSFPSADTADW